jgi:hypothetical protein
MDSESDRRPPPSQGLPKKSRRQKGAPKPMAAPASQKPLAQQIDSAFDKLRNDLVVAHRFEGLAQMARAKLWGDPARSDDRAVEPGDELVWSQILFGVTSLAVKELSQADRAAAVEAVKAYVTDVLPRAWAAGAPTPDLKALAIENGLVRDLRQELDIVDAGPPEYAAAPRPEQTVPVPPVPDPVVPAPTAPSVAGPAPTPAPAGEVRLVETPPEPATGEAPPAVAPLIDAVMADEVPAPKPQSVRGPAPLLDDAKATVEYEEILEQCLAARKNKRKVILVAGLPTTGKSFLMQRLEHVLRRTHSRTTRKGLPQPGMQSIDRTKTVLLYKFSRIGKETSPENFDIYDMPGDWFSKLVRDGFVASTGEVAKIRLVYAIAAFADAMIFIAPALHTLQPRTFLATGDDDTSLTEDLRQLRLNDMEHFISSLGPMTKVFSLLRAKTAQALRTSRSRAGDSLDARREAVNAAIDQVLPMTFAEIDEVKVGRMNMPAMLLLSRADELERRLPASRDWYDQDPTRQVLLRAREHLDHLANRFDAFTVDFLTAQVNETHTTVFDRERPSAGVGGLIKGWLLPAIAACRAPAPIRALRAPSLAYFIRRHLDPGFAEAWDLDENIS